MPTTSLLHSEHIWTFRGAGPCMMRSKLNKSEHLLGSHMTCDWPMASWVMVAWGLPWTDRQADRQTTEKHYLAAYSLASSRNRMSCSYDVDLQCLIIQTSREWMAIATDGNILACEPNTSKIISGKLTIPKPNVVRTLSNMCVIYSVMESFWSSDHYSQNETNVMSLTFAFHDFFPQGVKCIYYSVQVKIIWNSQKHDWLHQQNYQAPILKDFLHLLY